MYILGYIHLMALLDYDTKMLMQKRGFWYYQRRVPKKYAHIDARRFVKKALRTKSVDEAISKRDALIIADNEYWEALSLEALEIGGVSETSQLVAQHRYQASTARALSFGLQYKPASRIAAEEPPEAVYERVALLMQQSAGNTLPKKEDVFAVLGGDPKPSKGNITVSKAFSLYLEKISYDDQYNKDAYQLYSWKKTKKTSIDYLLRSWETLTWMKSPVNMPLNT